MFVDFIDKSSFGILLLVLLYYTLYSVYNSFVKNDFEKIIMQDSQKFRINLFYLLGQTIFFSLIFLVPIISVSSQEEYYENNIFLVSVLVFFLILIILYIIQLLEKFLTLKIEYFVDKEDIRLYIIKKLDDNSLLCRNKKGNLVILDTIYGLEIKEGFNKKHVMYKFYKDRFYIISFTIIIILLILLFVLFIFTSENELFKQLGKLAILLNSIFVLFIWLNHILYLRFKKKFDENSLY